MAKTRIKPDEPTFRTIWVLSKIGCTKAEVAAVFAIGPTTLRTFFTNNATARKAWDHGKAKD